MMWPPVHLLSTNRLGPIGAGMLALTLSLSAMASTSTSTNITSGVPPMGPSKREVARIVYPGDRPMVVLLPGGGTHTVRSLLNVRRRLTYGDYVWNDTGAGSGRVLVRVDLGRQLVSVFRGGNEIGTAVMIYGTERHPTPTGMLKIRGKVRDYRSRRYGVPMAYTLWLTSDGIAIHASEVRAGFATHGCVGLPTGFARQLFDVIRVGDKVAIVPEGST